MRAASGFIDAAADEKLSHDRRNAGRCLQPGDALGIVGLKTPPFVGSSVKGQSHSRAVRQRFKWAFPRPYSAKSRVWRPAQGNRI